MAILLFGCKEGSQCGMAQSVCKQGPESRKWRTQVGLWSFMCWIWNDPSMRMIRPREIESSSIVRSHRPDDLCLPLCLWADALIGNAFCPYASSRPRERGDAQDFLSLVWFGCGFRPSNWDTHSFQLNSKPSNTCRLHTTYKPLSWVHKTMVKSEFVIYCLESTYSIVVFLYMFSSQTFLQQAIKFCSNSAVFLLSNGQCGRTSGITAWRRTAALQARWTKRTKWWEEEAEKQVGESDSLDQLSRVGLNGTRQKTVAGEWRL